MSASVYGLLSSDTQANTLVSALKQAGFRVDDISVLLSDKSNTRDFAHEKNTKSPEGAATGGVLGGALGWMAGIGLLAIPGLGLFIAAGPILAALSGAAIGAAVGGLTGKVIRLGILDFKAKRYEGKTRDGRILASVHVNNGELVSKAKQVFKDNGANYISSSGDASADTKSPLGTNRDEATTTSPQFARRNAGRWTGEQYDISRDNPPEQLSHVLPRSRAHHDGRHLRGLW